MVEPVDIISGLETAAPIIGGISTLVLAALYWKQHDKISEQADILEEQQKVAKLEQTPYLVGPYNMKYDGGSETLYLELSNVGGGPARYVKIYMEFIIPNNRIDINECTVSFSRKDVSFMEPNTIYPNEMEVGFVADMGDVEVEVEDKSDSLEEFEADIEDVIDALSSDPRFDIINIRFRVEYTDIFGEQEDPFGRDYAVRSPTTGISPEMGFYGYLSSVGLTSLDTLDKFGGTANIRT